MVLLVCENPNRRDIIEGFGSIGTVLLFKTRKYMFCLSSNIPIIDMWKHSVSVSDNTSLDELDDQIEIKKETE
jgi:hypothetical protein